MTLQKLTDNRDESIMLLITKFIEYVVSIKRRRYYQKEIFYYSFFYNRHGMNKRLILILNSTRTIM